jgi:hypothetical protein
MVTGGDGDGNGNQIMRVTIVDTSDECNGYLSLFTLRVNAQL